MEESDVLASSNEFPGREMNSNYPQTAGKGLKQQQPQQLTLKTASLMHRKSRGNHIPAMNASFFSECDYEGGGDDEDDDVEEKLLRAFLLEKAKQAQQNSASNLDGEDTTGTASCTSEDNSQTMTTAENGKDIIKKLETPKELTRQKSSSGRNETANNKKRMSSSSNNKASSGSKGKSSGAREAIEKTCLKSSSSKGRKASSLNAKQVPPEGVLEKPPLKKTISRGKKPSRSAVAKEGPGEAPEERSSLKTSSRESLKRSSSSRRRISIAASSGGPSEHRRSRAPSRHLKVHKSGEDSDDDRSVNSFYNEALELDEGSGRLTEDGKSKKAEVQEESSRRREVSKRGRRTGVALSEAPKSPAITRREHSSRSRRSSIAMGEANHNAPVSSSDTHKSASVELPRVTRNPRGRGSVTKLGLQQILNQCDDLDDEEPAGRAPPISQRAAERAQRAMTDVSANDFSEPVPPPPSLQLRVSDALFDAEGDHQDALQRLLRSAKERRASAPLIDDSSSEDESDDDNNRMLAAVQQTIARSAIPPPTAGLVRRRSSIAKPANGRG